VCRRGHADGRLLVAARRRPGVGVDVDVGGMATIAPPGTTAVTPLESGASTTEFTVALPANAACAGDTAHQGFHVYSYLVRRGTDLSAVTFVNYPSAGYGIVDTTGTYYGVVNTAISTGQIIGIPNDFKWAPLVTTDGGSVALSQLLYSGTTGVWETGIACADTHGKLSADWNTEITFSASSNDPHGFTWSTVPAGTSPTGATGATGTAGSTGGTGPTTASTTGSATSGQGTNSVGTHSGPGSKDKNSSNGAHSSAAGPAAGAIGAGKGSTGVSDLAWAGIAAAVVAAAGAGLLLVRRVGVLRSGGDRTGGGRVS
jgi:hypothetical protein